MIKQASARVVAVAGILLAAFAARAAAQSADSDPTIIAPVVRSGLKIDDVSTYAGGYSFGSPSVSSLGSAAGGEGSGPLAVGGISTGLAWDQIGQVTSFTAHYRVDYNGNPRESQANGFDNIVDIGWRWTPSERWTVLVDASADSEVFGGFLFSRPSAMDATENLDAATTFTSAAATASGAAVDSSPLAYALYGAKRRDLTAAITLAYMQSARLTWKVGANMRKSLPVEVNGAEADEGATLPPVTDDQVVGGLEYILTPRDTLGADAAFVTSYSGYARTDMVTGNFSAEHLIARDWFVRGEAGAGELTELLGGTGWTNRRVYREAAGIGWKRAKDTLTLSERRDAGDQHGFGASSSLGFDVAEIYHAPASPWLVEASAGYERLVGGVFSSLSGWLAQVTLHRQLAPRLRWSMQAIYGSAAISPSVTSSTESLVATARRGVRMSLDFTPDPRLKR
jgi:hypothetical protein